MKNYDLLKKNAEGLGIEVLELSDVIAVALGIKIKEKAVEEDKTMKEDENIEKEIEEEN